MANTILKGVALLALMLSAPAGAQPAPDESKQAAQPAAAAQAPDEGEQVSAPPAESANPAPGDVAAIPVVAEPLAPPPTDEATQLDEIVVTATKREANPRDLPTSVSAIDGDHLESLGYQSQEDYLKLVPGVTFVNDHVTPNRITIRGIGADLNTSNTVGVFLGDVPFEDPTLPRVTLDPNPFDIARIEVLKGPQGTLFGGSALNGAIRYVPQEPMLGLWQTKAFYQIEEVTQGALEPTWGAAVNAPVGNTLAFRVMGFDRTSPGFIDDNTEAHRVADVNRLDQQGGRLMALWEPGEAWKISLMAVVQETQLADSAITDNRQGRLSRANTPKASPAGSRYDLETLGVQYAFDNFDLLSQTSRTYKEFDTIVDISRIGTTNDNPPDSAAITGDNQSDGLMQELRFTSNAGFDAFDGDLQWLGGAFYRRVNMDEVIDILASTLAAPGAAAVAQGLGAFVPGFAGTLTEDGEPNVARGKVDFVNITEIALFGEATMTFWDALDVTLGLRAFRTISDSRVRFSGAVTTDPNNPQTEKVSEGVLKEDGINPKLAVKYDFSANLAAYGAVTRGYRFGGAQVLVGTLTSPAPAFYRSDTLWSYELGLRTQWLGRTLFADVTGFHTDWTDPQLQQADASGAGAFFDNVGGAKSDGVELALRWLTPLPGMVAQFNGAYVDTVTTKPFTTSSGVDTQPGTQWPLAARKQSATTLAYQRPLFRDFNGGASLLYTTLSEAPNTLGYRDTVFGYETLDASFNLSNPGWRGAPALSLTLANALDERGPISGSNNPQFTKDRVYIRPRTLIARLTLSF